MYFQNYSIDLNNVLSLYVHEPVQWGFSIATTVSYIVNNVKSLKAMIVIVPMFVLGVPNF